MEILPCLQEEDNMDSAILKYQNNYRKDMSYDEITDIIIKKINPILKQSKTKSALIWHKEIINNETLKKYSAYLEKLFYWKYIFIVCSIALTLDVCFFIHTDNILNFNNIANIDILIGLLIFVFVSSLFHELGHATACTKKKDKSWRNWNWIVFELSDTIYRRYCNLEITKKRQMHGKHCRSILPMLYSYHTFKFIL